MWIACLLLFNRQTKEKDSFLTLVCGIVNKTEPARLCFFMIVECACTE